MITEYTSPVDYPARRGRPAIAKGTKLYAVKKGGTYFIWSYIDKAAAEKMDVKLGTGPTDAIDNSANWRRDLTKLTPSAITPEQIRTDSR